MANVCSQQMLATSVSSPDGNELTMVPKPANMNNDITVMSYWARWRLKSPAPRSFTQPFIQAQTKENIKAPRHWPFCGEFTGDREFPAQIASNAENIGDPFQYKTILAGIGIPITKVTASNLYDWNIYIGKMAFVTNPGGQRCMYVTIYGWVTYSLCSILY